MAKMYMNFCNEELTEKRDCWTQEVRDAGGVFDVPFSIEVDAHDCVGNSDSAWIKPLIDTSFTYTDRYGNQKEGHISREDEAIIDLTAITEAPKFELAADERDMDRE